MNFMKSAALGKQGATLGIRPEHLRLERGAGAISGTVSHVEKLGGETLVYVQADPHGLLTVRLFGEHDFNVGEAVGMTLDDGRVMLFDDQGKRLRAAVS